MRLQRWYNRESRQNSQTDFSADQAVYSQLWHGKQQVQRSSRWESKSECWRYCVSLISPYLLVINYCYYIISKKKGEKKGKAEQEEVDKYLVIAKTAESVQQIQSQTAAQTMQRKMKISNLEERENYLSNNVSKWY